MKGEKVDLVGVSRPFPWYKNPLSIIFRFVVGPVVALVLTPCFVVLFVLTPLALLSRMAIKGETWHQATHDIRRYFVMRMFKTMRPNFTTNIPAPYTRTLGKTPLHLIEFSDLENLIFDEPGFDSYHTTGCVRVPAESGTEGALLEFVKISDTFIDDQKYNKVVIVFGSILEVGDFWAFENRAASVIHALGEGYTVYQYNRRNTGASLGRFDGNPEILIDDAVKFISEIQKLHPNKEITCLGCSFGAWEATNAVARMHQLSKSKESNFNAPLPKIFNMNSFSSVANLVWGQLGEYSPVAGHLVGLFISIFMKIIGLEFDTVKAWSKIPNTHKEYQVLQAPKGVDERYDPVVTDFGALHNARSVKAERKKRKKALRRYIKLNSKKARLNGLSQTGASSEELLANAVEELEAIKDRKVCCMRARGTEQKEMVPGPSLYFMHHISTGGDDIRTRASHRPPQERLREFVDGVKYKSHKSLG